MADGEYNIVLNWDNAVKSAKDARKKIEKEMDKPVSVNAYESHNQALRNRAKLLGQVAHDEQKNIKASSVVFESAEQEKRRALKKTEEFYERNAKARSRSNHNRAIQQAFNAQQIVEDYQFAGFRGISNNIAFMAAQSQSAAATWGLWGLAIGTVVSALVDWDDVAQSVGLDLQSEKKLLEANKKAVDDYVNSVRDAIDLRSDLFEFNKSDKPEGNTAGSIDEAKQSLKLTKERLATEQHNLRIERERAVALERIKQANEDTQSSLKFKLAAQSTASGIDGGVADWDEQLAHAQTRESLSKIRENLRDIENRQKGVNGAIKEYESTVRKLEQEQRTQESILRLMERRASVFLSIAENQKKVESLAIEGLETLSAREALEASNAKLVEDFDTYRERAQERASKAIDEQQAKITAMQQQMKRLSVTSAEFAELEEKILKTRDKQQSIQEKVLKTIQDIKETADEEYQFNQDRIQQLKDLEAEQKKVEQSLESQISKTQSLIQSERARVGAIRDAQMASNRSFQNSIFGAKSTIISSQAQSYMDRVNQAAERLRRMAEAQFSGPFDDQKKAQALAWIDQQAQARLRWAEKEERARQARLKQNQFDFLKGSAQDVLSKADAAAMGGENAKAQKLYGEAQALLKEAQQFALGEVGNVLPGKKNGLMEQAKILQDRIATIYDKQATLANKVADTEQGRLHELKTRLLEVEGIEQSLQNTQFINQKNVDAAAAISRDLKAAAWYASHIASLQGIGNNPLGKDFPQFDTKASGGYLKSGVPTLVGEEGPEMIFPTRSDYVANAKDTQNVLGWTGMPTYTNTSGSVRSGNSTNISFGNVTMQASGVTEEQIFANAARKAKASRIRRG